MKKDYRFSAITVRDVFHRHSPNGEVVYQEGVES
jgi:hypothetical protein